MYDMMCDISEATIWLQLWGGGGEEGEELERRRSPGAVGAGAPPGREIIFGA